MSSYQQLYLGHIGPQDSTPDYLTCGLCAREFQLANITLFIAHKAVGCDASANKLSTESMQDTSSPLTCSMCSRVFLTARGLLQHAEQDHNMQICLKRGPLIIPDNAVLPPPAHSSLAWPQYVTDTLNRPVRGSDDKENDEPTDLSMSCSNKMGKAIIKCSDDECKITIKPNYVDENEGLDISPSSSTLPKKRKFDYGQSRQLNELPPLPETNETWSSFEPIEGVGSLGNEYGITDNASMNFEDGAAQNSLQLKSDPEVKVLVRAQYEQERLCCVSISTEKWKGNKADEIGEAEDLSTTNDLVMKSVCDEDCCSESTGSCSSNAGATKMTQLIYKLPKHVPRNPESAKPILVKNSQEETGWNASGMPKMDSMLSPTLATVSTTMTPPDMVFSPSSTTAFSTVPPASSSVSSSSLFPTAASDFGLISWNDTSTHYSDERSDQFMSSSVSDGTADEFQILKVKPPPSSTSAPPVVQKSNQTNHYSLTSQSPRLLTPQSNLNPLHSNFDFDMSPMSRKSSDDYAQTVNLDAQAFDTNSGAGFLHSSDVPTNTSGANDTSHMHSSDTASSIRSPSVDVLEEDVRREKQISKFAPINRSPVCQEERSDDQKNPVSNPEGDGLTPHDVQQLKKRRYPTSKPFECPQCDQAFNQRIHLKKHMSKHTGVKPFKCIHCDYSTVERSHLKVHYRVHTGEKPFKCPFCDYATAQNSTLKIHLKRHHQGLQNPKRSKFTIKNSSGSHGQGSSMDASQDPSSSRRLNGPAKAIPKAEQEQILSANFNTTADKPASEHSNPKNIHSSKLDHSIETSISSSTLQPMATLLSENRSFGSHYNKSQNPANNFAQQIEPNSKTSLSSVTLTSLLAKSPHTTSYSSSGNKTSMYPSQITASHVDDRGNSLSSLQSSTPDEFNLNSAYEAAPILQHSETWFAQDQPSHFEDKPKKGSTELGLHVNGQNLSLESSLPKASSHAQPTPLLSDSGGNQREHVDYETPKDFILSDMPENGERYESTLHVRPLRQVVIADKDFVRG